MTRIWNPGSTGLDILFRQMLIYRLIAVPLVVFLGMVTVPGQEPPPQEAAPAEEDPIIRVITELV